MVFLWIFFFVNCCVMFFFLLENNYLGKKKNYIVWIVKNIFGRLFLLRKNRLNLIVFSSVDYLLFCCKIVFF